MNQQVELPVANEPGSARLALSVAFAGLISGIAIIGIYEATLPTITANKARQLREAVFKVLPGVSRMQALGFVDGSLKPMGEDDEAADEDMTLYGGYDSDGRFIGYAIPSDGPGFQDTISLLYGYMPGNGKIVGMEILDSRETPGLGDKIYKDAVFVANFSALVPDPDIVTVKKGTRSAPNEVDAITGATISSKAVVRIINEGQARWRDKLPAPGQEPPLPEPAKTPATSPGAG